MNKGFTMVELIAVMVILSLVILIAIPAYNGVSKNIKQSSLDNKKNAITFAMEKYATEHLLDEIKPANEDCNPQSECCKVYKLKDDIIAKGIYDGEEIDPEDTEHGGLVVINPVTNKKLTGCVEIKYLIDKYELDSNFFEMGCEDLCK